MSNTHEIIYRAGSLITLDIGWLTEAHVVYRVVPPKSRKIRKNGWDKIQKMTGILSREIGRDEYSEHLNQKYL
jgi:hypothetical protein